MEVRRRSWAPTWELVGYAMWLVGSVLFAVTSWRTGDATAFAGSILFFIGIVLVMVPMARRGER